MDEYDEINLGVVQTEYETQRQRLHELTSPNLAKTPTKKLGCGTALLYLFVGMLLFRLILELFSFVG